MTPARDPHGKPLRFVPVDQFGKPLFRDIPLYRVRWLNERPRQFRTPERMRAVGEG